MRIKKISIDKIKENLWNPNKLEEPLQKTLVRNIKDKEIGYTQPIEVRPLGNREYEIIDGAHRFRACKEAGLKEIECIVSDYDNTQAKLQTLAKNKIRGTLDLVKAANLISDLNKELTLEEIGAVAGFKKVELKDTVDLLKLPPDFENKLRVLAEKEKREAPVVLNFVVSRDQAEVINQAIETLMEREEIKQGRALELICADFLAGEV